MKIKYITIACKSLLITIGCLVLLKWVFAQTSTDIIGIAPGTAINFILLGIALSLQEKHPLQAILQKIIFSLILILIFFPLSHISWLSDSNLTSGRFALNTSIAFILSALCGLLLPYGHKRFIGALIQLFTGLILLSALIGLLMYDIKWELIFNWYHYARMTPNTAICFILVCLAFGGTWTRSAWYKAYYQGHEDKKIILITGIILLFSTMITGLGSIAGLTNVNIETIQHLVASTLQNKVHVFTETIDSLKQDLEDAVSNPVQTPTGFPPEYINNTKAYLSEHGFKVFKLITSNGTVVYKKGVFNPKSLMEVPLKLSFTASLFWEKGFWFKAQIPIYDESHLLLGYLITEKFLYNLTHVFQNYENLGNAGEIMICSPRGVLDAECFPSRSSPGKNLFSLKQLIPISYVFEGLSGVLNSLDSNNRNIMTTYSPIGTLGLGMIIKIATTEFYKPIQEQLRFIFLIGLMLIFCGLILLKLQVAPLVRKVVSSEKEAQDSNKNILQINKALEQHNHETYLLHELSSALQSTLNMEEADMIIAQYGKRLFPDLAMIFYLMHASHNYLESKLVLGTPKLEIKILNPEDCWGLRRGNLHLVKNTHTDIICPHSQKIEPNTPIFCCIPLLAQNDPIGLLYLEWDISTTPTWLPKNEEQLNLAVTFSEQIALAISNIKLRETLRSQSIRDTLTGLYNRRYLEESLDREIHRLQRKEASMALLMIDIDRFKYFNDTFGHKAGDVVLQALGQCLRDLIRQEDIACRYGGEEFIVVLSEISLPEAIERAQSLHDQVNQLRLTYAGSTLGAITVSIGIAIYPEHGTTVDSLILMADTALYKAKNSGRNKTVVYDK